MQPGPDRVKLELVLANLIEWRSITHGKVSSIRAVLLVESAVDCLREALSEPL